MVTVVKVLNTQKCVAMATDAVEWHWGTAAEQAVRWGFLWAEGWRGGGRWAHWAHWVQSVQWVWAPSAGPHEGTSDFPYGKAQEEELLGGFPDSCKTNTVWGQKELFLGGENVCFFMIG